MFAKETQSKFGCFSNIVVWVSSSRWRKASKCKHHIENLLCSIKVHRRRRETMVRQSRSDIAQLLPDGRFSEAVPKAKQFYEDERRISAYDHVEYLCTSILENFSPILCQIDVNLLPEEIKEAMAGLIFSATRIGELTELRHIRSLFFERFGREFDKDCVDLRPGNIVNSEIIKILDTRMSQEEITPEILTGISQNVTSSAESSEDSTSSDNHGNKVMKENSKFMHPNLGEANGRDR
ncbi:hypothetical protein AALP_AA8G042500 [Arabis alpina]|uniref:Uncharacterized protein n=1 Tax=Arabis alpina TaxID=50452 RepID=A0A087G4X0_ARAAL|nr:hypothetical protein AALP_AA8G042500 [Arabis alpina]